MENYFAVAAPGLEELVAQELSGLGLRSQPVAAVPLRSKHSNEEGGITFQGEKQALYLANLCLRTATRVLVRMEPFYAAAFSELRKKAGRLPWEKYIKPGQPVTIHATCHKSRLYHSGAVAERVAGAIGDRLEKPSPLVKGDEEQAAPPQLVVVRLVNDQCFISIDSSGELLHRRGYRLATAKAPLRETLAAAMLLASAWDGTSPLLDPFCGSGTIAIEAALMALGRPPGWQRRFAFMDWPGFDRRLWKNVQTSQTTPSEQPFPIIQASDRDAGAIRLAQANAERAGVLDKIDFTCRAVSAIEPPAGPGWVVTNPPYGVRVSANKDLRNLYAQLGHVLRQHCPGWKAAILCNDPQLIAQTELRLDTTFSMINGGVNVRLARGMIR